MTREETRKTAGLQRRQEDEGTAGDDRAIDDWGDIDEFSARGSEPMLRQLNKEEAAAGFSWKKETLTGEPMPDVAVAVGPVGGIAAEGVRSIREAVCARLSPAGLRACA